MHLKKASEFGSLKNVLNDKGPKLGHAFTTEKDSVKDSENGLMRRRQTETSRDSIKDLICDQLVHCPCCPYYQAQRGITDRRDTCTSNSTMNQLVGKPAVVVIEFNKKIPRETKNGFIPDKQWGFSSSSLTQPTY